MTRRVWTGLAMAIALGSITAGGVVISQDGGGGEVPAGTAHIWVDGSGTCVDNATPVAYDSATACATFDNANDTCDNGDTVKIVGGSAYSSVAFSGQNSRSADCIMEEAEGQTVEINGTISFGGSAYISIEGIDLIGGTSAEPREVSFGGGSTTSNHITVINFTAVPGRIFIKGFNLSIIGGEFGGYNSCDSGGELDGIQVSYVSGQPSSHDLLFDGIYVHDVRKNPNTCSSAHTDCLQFLGVEDGIVRNSRFVNCPTIGIIARPQGGANIIDGLLIENNFIGPVLDGTEAFNIGSSPDACSNVITQYNTFPADTGTYDCPGGGSSGNIVRGNYVGGSAACHSSATYSFNRWSSGACGSSAATCTPTFVDASSNNYHIQSSDTCLKGAGDDANHPAEDFDGDLRNTDVDIGADEIAG